MSSIQIAKSVLAEKRIGILTSGGGNVFSAKRHCKGILYYNSYKYVYIEHIDVYLYIYTSLLSYCVERMLWIAILCRLCSTKMYKVVLGSICGRLLAQSSTGKTGKYFVQALQLVQSSNWR